MLMKKAALIMLAISMLTASTASAADPVKITGTLSVTYERDNGNDEPAIAGTTYSVKLLGEKPLGSGWSAYMQLGGEYATEPSLADFNTADEAYGADRKTVIAIDQYGLIYQRDGMVYKLGRQDATVGITALLYGRTNTYIGKNRFVDGLAATGTVGKVEISTLAAREDNPGKQNNILYAIRTGYNISEQLNCGLTWGHYKYSNGVSTDHRAVDGTYKFGKNTLTAEYATADSPIANKAYDINWTYKFDDRKSIYITFFSVGKNGDMGEQSGFDNDMRGTYYGLTCKLGKTDSLDLVYRDQKLISTGQKNDKFIATLSRSF